MASIFKDYHGNTVFVKGGKIRLRIKGTDRVRTLFHIHKDLNYIACERKPSKHLHRKSNSYGFNWDVLQKADIVENVLVREGKKNYLVPIQEIKNRGTFLWFSTKQCELQIFLSLDEIKKYRIDE